MLHTHCSDPTQVKFSIMLTFSIHIQSLITFSANIRLENKRVLITFTSHVEMDSLRPVRITELNGHTMRNEAIAREVGHPVCHALVGDSREMR